MAQIVNVGNEKKWNTMFYICGKFQLVILGWKKKLKIWKKLNTIHIIIEANEIFKFFCDMNTIPNKLL